MNHTFIYNFKMIGSDSKSAVYLNHRLGLLYSAFYMMFLKSLNTLV